MRVVGAALLVAAAYICGALFAREEGEKLRALEGLISMLRFLKRRMESEVTPLYALFAAYKNEYLESTGFLALLRSFGTRAPYLWGEALGMLPLEGTARRELLHFGESLGRLELSSQLKSIDACLALLEQEKERLRLSVPMKQKSIKAVAFLSGALAAIILI